MEHSTYDLDTRQKMEERLKKDDLEKDIKFISELKKSYDTACKDKFSSGGIGIKMLMHLHLMTLTKEDRETVLKRCGMIKEGEVK